MFALPVYTSPRQRNEKPPSPRMSANTTYSEQDDLEHRELTESVAARLRPVCPHLNDLEFGALVADIVRVKLKYRLPPKSGEYEAQSPPSGNRDGANPAASRRDGTPP